MYYAFAFRFKKSRLSTTLGSDIETNKFCGQVSTIMKVISNEDDDLSSQFGKINENDIPLSEKKMTHHHKLEICLIKKG